MRVGSEDILLPTTMVGNYPNPRWYDGLPNSKLPPGTLVYDSITREAYEDAVLAIVHDQESAGLDIISDGRVHGGDSPYGQVIYHYYERMRGYEMHGPNIGLPIYSSLYAPTVVGEVSRRSSFAMDTLRAVRRATRKPIKISYQGIHVLAAASNDEYYKDMRDLAIAIAKAYREDFKELADVGVEIVQLDEFLWPYEMGDWQIEVFNLAMDDIPGIQFWAHACWGNYGGTPGFLDEETAREFDSYVLDKRADDAPAPERAKAIFPQVKDTHMHVLNYEVGRTGPADLEPLREHNWDRDFVAGVIDVKSTITETAQEVARRIRAVLEYVPAERLGLTTDCGLVLLQRMTAQAKLRALADGAAIVRQELAAANGGAKRPAAGATA
ncbi:MAG: cobalamin-independent methionine synthase II family protein [Solirubrobacterales bacterium]|nr:cobalamin-independent methionine synthase II family protein [Solirubrobacterales bacterium]